MTTNALGLGCGRRTVAQAAGDREPFVFPDTERRYAPDRTVDIRHTRIEIALDPTEAAIAGAVTHTFAALSDDTREVRLHAGELEIEAAETSAGDALAFSHQGHDLVITLPGPLDFGDESAVVVRYRGRPRRGIYFVGPDEGYPDKPPQAWTQGQDEDSRFWFPCFDHPSERASTDVVARVPSKYRTISNGALVERTEHDDGTVSWHWHLEAEHPAYLVSLVVGEFAEVEIGDTPVEMRAYVAPGREKDAARAFGRTPEMMQLFGDRFGIAYPYEKYAQVVVEDFIFGGMENTSATTMIDLILYDDRAALDADMDNLVAHELAHQWWGDLLTCREWSHAWLNEGFATWSELVWMEHDKGVDEAAYQRLVMTKAYLAEDRGLYRRAIVDRRYDEPLDLFDRHLYEKGGLVLHMLRRELGEASFWRAIQAYAAQNRGRTVVTEDLRRSIESATGRNLDWFFDQWIHHAGHPELIVSWKHAAKDGLLALTVKQTQSTGEEMVDCFRATVPVTVVTKTGAHASFRVELTRRDHTFHLPLADEPAQVVFDPEGDLLAVVKLEQPAASSRAVLASDAPLMARIRAAHALVEEPTPASVEALAAVLPEGFWGLAAEAAAVLGRMRLPAARDALVAALAKARSPKTRRGIVAALGAFRHDETAGQALREVIEDGDPSIFVEGTAATALGATRTARARDIIESALATRESWGEAIRVGCVGGLAALGTDDVLPAILASTRYGQPPRLRAAAVRALAHVGRRMATREPVIEVLGDLLGDPDFRVLISTIDAFRILGDERGIEKLRAGPDLGADGRIRRAARSTIARLRKGGERSTEVARLSDDLERLRKQTAELTDRVAKLEAHAGSAETGETDGAASSPPA
jgi:aminopeptidase N